MEPLKHATLIFLVKKTKGKITEICIAMKKRGFGVNKWNGVGGKVNSEIESIEDAAKREAKEEIDVGLIKFKKVAELFFYFPYKPEWNQIVHTYFCTKWTGSPKESEEMNPKWVSIKKIPYKEMWPDDAYWLPIILKGKIVNAKFTFGENEIIQNKEIDIVNEL